MKNEFSRAVRQFCKENHICVVCKCNPAFKERTLWFRCLERNREYVNNSRANHGRKDRLK